MPGLRHTFTALRDMRRLAPENGAVESRMTTGSVCPNPGALNMLTYVPNGLSPGSTLVVVLHGCMQTGEGYARGAGWLDLADRYGFVVLCPQQTSANNPNRCFNWFEPGDTRRDQGEAASIAAMVKSVVAAHMLDPRQVFITGLSAGGAMTAAMAAAYPEVFAGAAIIAGLPHGAASNISEALGAMARPRTLTSKEWGDKVRLASDHEGPWPAISIWHGDADATVRPASAAALVSQWTDVHRVSGVPSIAVTSKGRQFEVWMAGGQGVVEHHRLHGMGHGTPIATVGPDACGSAGPFLLDVGVASSLEIASGWGIASVLEVDQARPMAQHRDGAAVSGDPWRSTGRKDAAAGPREFVARTIEDALKAAGLLRR